MYAVLPKNAKPSKTASKDATRPILCRGELVNTGDDWFVVTTDSYALAIVPVVVKDMANINTPALEAGPIPADALVAIEKAGAFTANGAVCPVDENGTPVAGAPSFERRDDGTFPNYVQLVPDTPRDVELQVGFNPSLLLRLAQSLGHKETKRGAPPVVLHLNVSSDVLEGARERGYVKAIRVSHEGAGGVLMPIRVNQ